MTSKSILDIKNISIKYGEQAPVVENLSMTVKNKEIVGIVGESGSGKSTIIRAVLGLLPAGAAVSSGNIIFKNEDIFNYSERKWREIRGNRMAVIFQDSGEFLTPVKKVGNQFVETIRSHFRISKKEAFDKAVFMIKKMDMADAAAVMNSYPFQLSGGMKQRVAIAMAMVMKPELLLADEPTSALDVTVQAQVVKQMAELRKNFNTSIVLVTHNLGVAAYICDKIGVMQEGRLVEWGTKDQVINNPRNKYTMELLSAVPELEGCDFGGKEAAYTGD
ncbi:ABC transporter ATP-binding protein [Clostridium sp. JNZ X4-2]